MRALFVLLMTATTPVGLMAQFPALEVRASGGIAEYIGDNNTRLFNPEAFRVAGKRPVDMDVEAGLRLAGPWSLSVGFRSADYPIVTRFYHDLDVADHTTRRRSWKVLARRWHREGAWRWYTAVGYHLTFGSVQIFEVSRIQAATPLNTQQHYIHGPLVGVGLDYSISGRISLFLDLTGLITRMDDSVDGRLPLGPPQPTNLREPNRFGSFDLLNAYNLGVAFRTGCLGPCRPDRRPSGRIRRVELGTLPGARVSTAALLSSFPWLPRRVMIGVEAGSIPRSIHVRYTYPDGQESLDHTGFTGTFVGLVGRYQFTENPLEAHGAITAAFPAQVHVRLGTEIAVVSQFRVGAEMRAAWCPRRRQDLYNPVDGIGELRYRMNRVCDFAAGVALTAAYRMGGS